MQSVRITFRVETIIDGRNLNEIKSKFEDMDLPLDIDFVELVSVEDYETRNDLKNEWDELD